jgi:hypothetical protein
VVTSSGNELFASETSSSDLLAKPLVLSVVVRNLRPALLRNVVMDGSDVGLAEEARGILAVVRFDKAAVRVLPVSGRREMAHVS